MKKTSIMIAMAGMLAAGALGSCVRDTQPRIEKPTEFVLNEPFEGNNTLVLSPTATLSLSWSQPDYGVGTVPEYQVEIAEDEAFTNPIVLPTIYTAAKATLEGSVLAKQIQDAQGWASSDDVPDTPLTYYVRVKSVIPNWEDGTIYSNAWPLSLLPYYVVSAPRDLYLVGQPEGWDIAGSDKWILKETGIETDIYEGSFDIPAGEFQFRFYTKTGDWEWNSVGSQDDDKPVDISLTDGEYTGEVFYDPTTKAAGKGSWQIPDWTGGVVTITVNMKEKTIRIVSGAVAKVLYVVGACSANAWNIDNSGTVLTETPAGSGIYEGEFDVAADAFTFRIYSEPGDWNANSLGSIEGYSNDDDADTDITLPYSGNVFNGKGKWAVPGWAGGKIHVKLNLTDMTIDIVSAE